MGLSLYLPTCLRLHFLFGFPHWALTIPLLTYPLTNRPSNESCETTMMMLCCFLIITHQVKNKKPKKKHTTVGIRWWSPTQLLIYRFRIYVWQSGRDAQYFRIYGRMYQSILEINYIKTERLAAVHGQTSYPAFLQATTLPQHGATDMSSGQSTHSLICTRQIEVSYFSKGIPAFKRPIVARFALFVETRILHFRVPQ